MFAAQNYRSNLMRNNVGALEDSTGRIVRYGLANDSARVNKFFKSSDYIGITPVVVTPDMVGKTVAVFTAVEMKKEGWVFNPNDTHQEGQKNFIDHVLQAGGIAGFAASISDLMKIYEGFFHR